MGGHFTSETGGCGVLGAVPGGTGGSGAWVCASAGAAAIPRERESASTGDANLNMCPPFLIEKEGLHGVIKSSRLCVESYDSSRSVNFI